MRNLRELSGVLFHRLFRMLRLERRHPWWSKPKFSFARRALRNFIVLGCDLEYRLHRFVISAAGAKVMHWLSVPGRFFYAKSESSRVVLDQIVAGKISIAFFKLSNLIFKFTYASQRRGLALGGLKALILHGDYLCSDMHELNMKFIGSRRDLRFIQRFYSRLVG